MEISVSMAQANEAIAIIKIKGEINASNFTEIVDQAQKTYNNPARNLVIDLSEVTKIGSAGLVAIHKIALIYSGVPQNVEQDENPDFTHNSNARKHVKLLNPQPEVDTAIERAGLKLFFKIFKTLEDAIQSF